MLARVAIKFVGLVAGAIVGQAFIVLTGILAIQAFGIRMGAVFSLSNAIESITPAVEPWFIYIARAVLGATLVFYCFILSGRTASGWMRASVFGFSVALGVNSFVAISASSMKSPLLGDALAVQPGWQGWVQYGAQDPVTYMLCVLGLGLTLFPILFKTGTAKSADPPFSQ